MRLVLEHGSNRSCISMWLLEGTYREAESVPVSIPIPGIHFEYVQRSGLLTGKLQNK